jgi:hypothetical protein
MPIYFWRIANRGGTESFRLQRIGDFIDLAQNSLQATHPFNKPVAVASMACIGSDITYAANNSTGSTIDGSSFSGLLTRVEIGHICIGSARNSRIKS